VHAWGWIQSHRWLCVIFLAVVIIGTAGGTAWAVFFRTVSSPVSLGEALRLYRRTANNATPGSKPRPFVSGVFGYKTTGGESLSLLDQSRTFPTRTNMLMTAGSRDCSDVSWVPITQHTESMTVCPEGSSGSEAVTDFTTFEQISGTTTTTVVECPATTYLVPPVATPGERWSSTCQQTAPTAPGQRVRVDGVVLGSGPVQIGAQSISTVHVRLTIHFSGPAQGTSPADFWISTSRGLLAREQETATIAQDGVDYTERMDSTLSSLTPLD